MMDTAEVSGCEKALFGERAPEDALVPIPLPGSEPFADAAELGARAELSEYREETDTRFESRSGIECFGRRAASGS